AQLEPRALVGAAEDGLDDPVRGARGVLVQLLPPGRGRLGGLGLLDELQALAHAHTHGSTSFSPRVRVRLRVEAVPPRGPAGPAPRRSRRASSGAGRGVKTDAARASDRRGHRAAPAEPLAGEGDDGVVALVLPDADPD